MTVILAVWVCFHVKYQIQQLSCKLSSWIVGPADLIEGLEHGPEERVIPATRVCIEESLTQKIEGIQIIEIEEEVEVGTKRGSIFHDEVCCLTIGRGWYISVFRSRSRVCSSSAAFGTIDRIELRRVLRVQFP